MPRKQKKRERERETPNEKIEGEKKSRRIKQTLKSKKGSTHPNACGTPFVIDGAPAHFDNAEHCREARSMCRHSGRSSMRENKIASERLRSLCVCRKTSTPATLEIDNRAAIQFYYVVFIIFFLISPLPFFLAFVM